MEEFQYLSDLGSGALERSHGEQQERWSLARGPPHEPGQGCECCLDHPSRSITGSGFSSENDVLEEERVIWAASGKERAQTWDFG